MTTPWNETMTETDITYDSVPDDTFANVDAILGRPYRAVPPPGPSVRHYFRGGAVRPGIVPGPWRVKGPVLRKVENTFADELAVLLPYDTMRRTLAQAADDMARDMFRDCPLALATIVRTGIVPWDIEYQTTSDPTTFERRTRLVEYERGVRRG